MSKLGQLWKSKPSRSLKENSLQHFANWQERLHPRQPKGDTGGQFRKKPLPVHTNYLRMDALKKVGPQMGSNPGGVFADKAGKHYYIKKGRSSQHVRNELASAALYKLAGGTVPSYVQVEGGQHVATEMLPLKKNSIADFTSEERQRVKDDFMIHAWLANWDAIGLGGDNQGIANGTPVTLDVGGSMLFRAQGGEKPTFGDDVPEVITLRDAKYNRDAAKAFSGMTVNELRASAKKVTGVSDESIRKVISRYDLPEALADKLIARKHYIAGKFGGERITEQVRQFKKFLREDYEYEGKTYKVAPHVVPAGGIITVVEPHSDKEFIGKKFKKGKNGGWEVIHDEIKPEPMDLQAKLAQANAAAEKPAESEKPKTGVEYEGRHFEHVPYNTLPVGAIITSNISGKKFAKNEPGYNNSWAEVPPKPPGVVSDGYLYKGKFYWQLPVDKIPIGDTVLNVTSKKKFVRYAQGGHGWESSWKEWDEKDHPRVGKGSPKGGQFTFKNKKPVVKKDSQKQNPYGGMYVTTGATPQDNHFLTIEKVLGGPAKIGIHYRRLLMKLIADSIKYSGSETATNIPKLKEKLIDSLMKTRDKLLNNGKGIAAQKIEAQLKKLGYDPNTKQTMAAAGAGEKDDESLTATAAKVLSQDKLNPKFQEEAEALAQQKKVMEELGINETEAGAFMGLVKMEYGGYDANEQLKNAIYAFKQQKESVEQLGIKEMTGFQAALIRNYTDGGYKSVNQALRVGSWTPEQHLYVQQVNKAIGALPKYSGVVQRGATLNSDKQALYKKGYIVEERALTSTGIGTDFGGNTKFYITATGKRAAHIKQLSNHPGENEVLFKSHTFFHVDDVKQSGNFINVYMTEIE